MRGVRAREGGLFCQLDEGRCGPERLPVETANPRTPARNAQSHGSRRRRSGRRSRHIGKSSRNAELQPCQVSFHGPPFKSCVGPGMQYVGQQESNRRAPRRCCRLGSPHMPRLNCANKIRDSVPKNKAKCTNTVEAETNEGDTCSARRTELEADARTQGTKSRARARCTTERRAGRLVGSDLQRGAMRRRTTPTRLRRRVLRTQRTQEGPAMTAKKEAEGGGRCRGWLSGKDVRQVRRTDRSKVRSFRPQSPEAARCLEDIKWLKGARSSWLSL